MIEIGSCLLNLNWVKKQLEIKEVGKLWKMTETQNIIRVAVYKSLLLKCLLAFGIESE